LPTITAEQGHELEAADYLPEPRLKLGQALQGIATAAQDVSDGLLADLGHIAQQSNVQIIVEANAVPLADVLRSVKTHTEALELALTAGDDYELVFTAPAELHAQVMAAAAAAETSITRIGSVIAGRGTQVLDADGLPLQFRQKGYDHFGINS
jgi:thiamine-monophosphate kinase